MFSTQIDKPDKLIDKPMLITLQLNKLLGFDVKKNELRNINFPGNELIL
jgi:hypothetical protein